MTTTQTLMMRQMLPVCHFMLLSHINLFKLFSNLKLVREIQLVTNFLLQLQFHKLKLGCHLIRFKFCSRLRVELKMLANNLKLVLKLLLKLVLLA